MTLAPSPREAQLLRTIHDERIAKMGLPCVLTNVKSRTDDRYFDSTITWDEPIDTHVIFDWSPKERLLKNLGWYKEDELPIVGQAKYKDNIRIGAYLELGFKLPSDDLSQVFEVVDIKVFGVGAAMTLFINLAPKRGRMASE